MREQRICHTGQERRDAHHGVELVSPWVIGVHGGRGGDARQSWLWMAVRVGELKKWDAQWEKSISFISIVYSLGLW